MLQLVIRDAVQDDVNAINRLFCDEYGDGYPYLIGMLNNSHVNVVADVDGRVVGFARATPYGKYEHAWELCSLVVHPNFRRYGIARLLTIERINHLRVRGVTTLVSEPVTCYKDCASQHNLLTFGFRPFGLLPFQHPWIRPQVLGEQPLTLALMVRELNGGTGFGDRPLFLTDTDRVAASLILDPSAMEKRQPINLRSKLPRIYFSKPKQVHGISGAECADVPLNWPISRFMAEILHAEGFKFGTILPGFGRTDEGKPFDLMRMYRPPEACLHPDAFNLVYVIPELEKLRHFCANELAR